MNYWNLFYIALRAIVSNKMRSFLTMLGMIIGVWSVITMLALGQGSKESIRSQLSEMGSNIIMIHPNMGMMGGVRQNASDQQSLKPADYESLKKECVHIAAITPQLTASGQLINGVNNAPSTLYGVNSDYLTIKCLRIKSGNMFNEHQIKVSAKVAVIGKTVADNIFPGVTDPVGQVFRFKNIPMTVIGVLEAKGTNSMGQDQDDVVLVPYTTVQKRILAINYYQSMLASAKSESESQAATEEITEILRRNHHITNPEDDDFSIRSMEELISTISSTTNVLTILLACIAGISLLVGGIGIMNIMFVSVTERTKEIGLRMAVGAKERHILLQFLIESVVISVTGGVIGILLGFLSAWVLTNLVHWNSTVQASSVILAFAVCTATGVFFGWYPAKKAARLDPIDAIHYE
ncbi:MAG: ABC transporter permease [Paludibacteraceae bacterium]|nr:ABC transporter permease [Paludibacteraceae bacterium]